MSESQQFRSAQEWLAKTRSGNLTFKDALLLLSEGPHHVAVLERLVRQLATRVNTPQPPKRPLTIARMPPLSAAVRESPPPLPKRSTSYSLTKDQMRQTFVELIDAYIEELDEVAETRVADSGDLPFSGHT